MAEPLRHAVPREACERVGEVMSGATGRSLGDCSEVKSKGGQFLKRSLFLGLTKSGLACVLKEAFSIQMAWHYACC